MLVEFHHSTHESTRVRLSTCAQNSQSAANNRNNAARFATDDLPVLSIHLDYECFGKPGNPALLLIMGLATQRTAWPQPWIDAFVARGFYVISFDNRDVGLSTRLDTLGLPKLKRVISKRLFGMGDKPPYSIQEMSEDALRLLDQLGIQRAHVLGVSMGGMMAQWLAISHPTRVVSLTLLMSSSGRLGLPLPAWKVLKIIAGRPKAGLTEREAAVDYLVRFFGAVGSPAFPVSESERRARAWVQVNRSIAGTGVVRQIAAITADGERWRRLAELALPCAVLHGDADKLVPPAHGKDLAARIPGASFELLAGVGHDVPDGLAELIADRVATLAGRAGQRST
jgi:pimeloyl-ACP methyl ester carboxylesterase